MSFMDVILAVGTVGAASLICASACLANQLRRGQKSTMLLISATQINSRKSYPKG